MGNVKEVNGEEKRRETHVDQKERSLLGKRFNGHFCAEFTTAAKGPEQLRKKINVMILRPEMEHPLKINKDLEFIDKF